MEKQQHTNSGDNTVTYFGLDDYKLERIYREALSTGRYVKEIKGDFKHSEINRYKRDYPLGEVSKNKDGVVIVVMPKVGYLNTDAKIKEFLSFYCRYELPQDLQGYILIDLSKEKEMLISYLSKGIDIGLRVYGSKFAMQWRVTWQDELNASLVTEYHNLPFPQLADANENIYYILKSLSDYLHQHEEVLVKVLEK